MVVTSAAVRTVTAGILRHWLLEPIGPMKTNAKLRGGRRPPTTTAHNASGITAFPLVLPHRFRCLHLTGGSLYYSPKKVCQIIVACCMLHCLALRHQVPFLQEDEPGDGLVAVVQPVDSEEEEAEEEDVDNRSNII
ncbi:hypothetical protein NDU88_004290 [Pleurodeles waltl]|uniref:Nuclease HARBI1 n=1 Tax=Pleurodeles waltl TaxID=8319 RepID=A0AAV7QC56_PLEWA|nr:hypothetical protein NDU88_004290 [Pleurodeles waltl]